MARPRIRVVVEIRGGNVVNVTADKPVDIYVLDYDNGTESDAESQMYVPYVGARGVNAALAEWDGLYRERTENDADACRWARGQVLGNNAQGKGANHGREDRCEDGRPEGEGRADRRRARRIFG